MLVSVILPTFNRSGYVVRALCSALAQTHANLEVLVVDDGSTDDTPEAVRAVADARVRHLRQDHSGLPAARNRGMAAARGDYIAFLDTDNTWMPWKIEAQLAVLAGFPAAGMMWTNYSGVDAAGTESHPRHLTIGYSVYSRFDPDRDFGECRLLDELWPACPPELSGTRCYAGSVYRWMFLGSLAMDSTVLLRRERQQATGEFDLRFSTSYDLYLRACEQGDVAFLDAASTRTQLTADGHLGPAASRLLDARDSLGVAEKALESSPAAAALPEALVRETLARRHHWIAAEELFSDRRSARRHLTMVLRSGRLTDETIRRNARLLLVLSYLPPRAVLGLKKLRRTVKAYVARLQG